jgi:hypothetical protein
MIWKAFKIYNTKCKYKIQLCLSNYINNKMIEINEERDNNKMNLYMFQLDSSLFILFNLKFN